MTHLKAIITEIERSSPEDGPGLRTVVFFKGCPLKCDWCHNPECISFEKQIMNYPEKCIGCGKCDEGCYSGAKVICGKEMTVNEIMAEILLDKPYYGKDGGVTFSGGEALAQPKMLKALIDLCKQNGIHTAIETSLYLYDEEIFKNIDFVMADLKLWDNDKHIKYTGVSNEIIKQNFKKLDGLGVPYIVRTPLIPSVTDSIENISAIRDFLKTLKNVRDYELLQYNPLGNSKLIALGLKPIDFSESKMTLKELERYADIH